MEMETLKSVVFYTYPIILWLSQALKVKSQTEHSAAQWIVTLLLLIPVAVLVLMWAFNMSLLGAVGYYAVIFIGAVLIEAFK